MMSSRLIQKTIQLRKFAVSACGHHGHRFHIPSVSLRSHAAVSLKKGTTPCTKNLSIPSLESYNHGIIINSFHTTPRKYIHPIFWILIKPVGKVASIISGRFFRKWWRNSSEEDKKNFKKKLLQSRGKIAALISLLVGYGAFNYYTHIQETPITKRRRYIAFTEEQFMKIAQFEFDATWNKLRDSIIDPRHSKSKKIYNIVAEIVENIVSSNQELDVFKTKDWSLYVVVSEEPNAFVLPGGQIFVYTGILQLTENVDQLAVVIGHEMAHVLLRHGAEKISFAGLVDVFIIFVMAAMWAFIPSDGIALVTQWFYNKVMKLLLDLPYSRKLESEADIVGLELIAKACYDVRQSSTFWEKMDIYEKMVAKGEATLPEWLSTHPASQNRATAFDELIPEAIKVRDCCKCPRLSAQDPRENIKMLRHILEEDGTLQAPVISGDTSKTKIQDSSSEKENKMK